MYKKSYGLVSALIISFAMSSVAQGYASILKFSTDMSQVLPGSVITSAIAQKLTTPAEYNIEFPDDLSAYKDMGSFAVWTYTSKEKDATGAPKNLTFKVSGWPNKKPSSDPRDTSCPSATNTYANEMAGNKPFLRDKNPQQPLTDCQMKQDAAANAVETLTFSMVKTGDTLKISGTGGSPDVNILQSETGGIQGISKETTTGTVKMAKSKSGKDFYVYTTAWKPKYSGFSAQKIWQVLSREESNSATWTGQYKYIQMGNGYNGIKNSKNYNACIQANQSFCIKKDGNKLIFASTYPLKNKVDFLIDWNEAGAGG